MPQDWSTDLATFLTAVWAEIGDLTHARAGYPGLAILATSSPNGPQLRQLVLREADRSNNLVILHTDNQTPKCAEIVADPRVSLLFWNPDKLLQIRLSGTAELLGPYAAKSAWAELPFATRGNYGVTPSPGQKIDAAHNYSRQADESRLAVISVTAKQIDAVHLGKPQHIRARYVSADDWAGSWVAP